MAEEQIKAEIAEKTAQIYRRHFPHSPNAENPLKFGYEVADQILSIKGICLKATKQTKPHTETARQRFGEDNDGYREGKEVMWRAMCYDGWVKCLEKEEHGRS